MAVVWSAVLRDKLVLAECGEDNHDGEVHKTACIIRAPLPPHGRACRPPLTLWPP